MSSAKSMDCDTTCPCSYCKREVALANVVLHEVHCMRHITLCPQCDEPVPKTQIEEHIAHEHSKMTCEQCEKELERQELEEHKVNNCVQRLVTCQYCEIELPFSKMEEHEDACGSRTEKCMTCESYIMIKNADEHKLSNCKPPRVHQDRESEKDSLTVDYTNDYDDCDDMLPCEFCGGLYAFDYLIQHESGCGKNAMGRNAFSSVHQPLRSVLQDNDVSEDEMRFTMSELEDLTFDPSNEEPENLKGGDSLTPKDQANEIPINKSRATDHVPNIQKDRSTVGKNTTDGRNEKLYAESAQNKTLTQMENDTSSFDVIPCEFCDTLISLTQIMDHQKTCQWVHPNMAYMQQRFAFNGENEYDFADSPTSYEHRYQRGRYNVGTVRGFSYVNAKWIPERSSNPPDRAQHNPDSTIGTSSGQRRSEGRPGFRSYPQDIRKTNEDDRSGRCKRTGYLNSRGQHEEQDSMRPMAKFNEDNQRQEGQREEQGTLRQQHEDSQWSKRQQKQPDNPSQRRQERNDNLKSRLPLEEPDIRRSKEGQQEQASMRLGAQNDTQEQKPDHNYRPQSRGQRVGVEQRLPWEERGQDKEISRSARALPEEEQNWIRNRPMDGLGQTRLPRGRGKPIYNHSNTGSERGVQENKTSREPEGRTEGRLEQKPARNRRDFRDEERQEVSHREYDNQGLVRSVRRGQGRGRRHDWGQERWNRTNDHTQGKDYYYKAWPRRSYQDHSEYGFAGQAEERPAKMNRGQKQDYARENLEYNGRRPTKANQGHQEGNFHDRQAEQEFSRQKNEEG